MANLLNSAQQPKYFPNKISHINLFVNNPLAFYKYFKNFISPEEIRFFLAIFAAQFHIWIK